MAAAAAAAAGGEEEQEHTDQDQDAAAAGCFRLAAALAPDAAHSDAVRAVAAAPGEVRVVAGAAWSSSSSSPFLLLAASASRDRTVRVWEPPYPPAERPPQSVVLVGHTNFVGAVAFIAPAAHDCRQSFPLAGVAAGGDDRRILIWSVGLVHDVGAGTGTGAGAGADGSVEGAVLVAELEGHTDGVSALAFAPAARDLVSAGKELDKTVRVWNLFFDSQGAGAPRVEVATLVGHERGVWDVVALANGSIASASADKTVRLWIPAASAVSGAGVAERWDARAVQTRVLRGHDDCVRGVAEVPGLGLVSAGNDCLVLLWSLEGERLRAFHGHDSFVYSVAVDPTGEWMVTASEDRTAKVWRIRSSEDAGAAATLPHPSTVWSATFLPNGDVVTGCQDGVPRVWTRDAARAAPADSVVVQNHEKAIASATIPAQSVGLQALDKSTLPGPERLRQPGSHDGQNILVAMPGGAVEAFSWSAADAKWMKVGTVVDAASSGAKQVLDGKEYDYVFGFELDGQHKNLGYNNGENPYIVAQQFLWREELPQYFLDQVARFIAENTTPTTIGGSPSVSDPLTGAHRYIPGDSPLASALPPPSGVDHFSSVRSAVLFDSANVPAIHKRIVTLSAEEPAVEPLTDAELGRLGTLCSLLSAEDAASAATPSSPALAEGASVVLEKILGWPLRFRFPALDLLRLVLASPRAVSVANVLLTRRVEGGFVRRVLELAEDSPVCVMFSLRCVANLFWRAADTGIQHILLEGIGFVLEQVRSRWAAAPPATLGIHLASATITLNLAVALSLRMIDAARLPDDLRDLPQTVAALAGALLERVQDAESAYRLLCAAGVLTLADPAWKAAAHTQCSAAVARWCAGAPGKPADAASQLRRLWEGC